MTGRNEIQLNYKRALLRAGPTTCSFDANDSLFEDRSLAECRPTELYKP